MDAFKSPHTDPENHLQNKWLGKNPKYVDGLDCSCDPGKTDPSQAADCDINNIVASYHKTGVFPSVNGPQLFADVSDAPSYQDALQIIINADNAFMSLDAKTRDRFNNDPTRMLAFLEDPNNRSEAVALGMINPPAPSASPAAPDFTGGQPAPSKSKSKPVSTPEDT